VAKAVIPPNVRIVVGSVLGGFYYNHNRLNALFAEAGAPGEPPEGNCQDKIQTWLKRCNDAEKVDALAVLGGVLAPFMETDTPSDVVLEGRRRIEDALRKSGLSYRPGGRILGSASAAPIRSLEKMLRDRYLPALSVEFERALDSVEKDPPAALTAACAILEALFKVYIKDLGLDPRSMADDDSARVLGGLASVVDGIGAWRTHASSAHGRGRTPYNPAPRHARLAVHASHTLVQFLIETWDDRKAKKSR
jgi:hypothetical protein